MPGGGITVLLARWIGLTTTPMECLELTGNFVAADEALRLGLVNHVVPHEELLPFSRGLAADIVSNDQTGVRRLLAHYRRITNTSTLDEAHLIEGYMAEQWHATPTCARSGDAATERGARRRRHEAEEPTRLLRQDSGRSEKMPGSPAWISIHSAPSSPASLPRVQRRPGLKYPMPAPCPLVAVDELSPQHVGELVGPVAVGLHPLARLGDGGTPTASAT